MLAIINIPTGRRNNLVRILFSHCTQNLLPYGKREYLKEKITTYLQYHICQETRAPAKRHTMEQRKLKCHLHSRDPIYDSHYCPYYGGGKRRPHVLVTSSYHKSPTFPISTTTHKLTEKKTSPDWCDSVGWGIALQT